MRYLAQLKSLYDNGNSEVLRHTKIVRSDGSEETTTQITNPTSGGILERIFGDIGKEEPKEDDIIDQDLSEVEDAEVKEEPKKR